MATPGKAKKEKKKHIPVKTSLNSPYDLRWAPLEKGQKAFIVNTLKAKIEALGLRKIQVIAKDFRSRKKAKKRDSEPADTKTEVATRQPGWNSESTRRQLAIGINEVTKGLERDELSLVLVCSSVKPAHMISHLIPLSRTREVPACQVPDLSECLSGLLGLSSVLALGFRRGAADFTETVGKIAESVPPLHVAWVPSEGGVTGLEVEGGDLPSNTSKTEEGSHSNPDKTEEQAGDDRSDPPQGLKRKRDLSLEPEGDPSPTLQPLKVKKTIPNPSKIRKPKKIKK